MSETRKLAAILVSDVVGYSRLAGADEDRILARLRTLRSDLIDPTIAVHHGRIVKRTGDGSIIEFRSVVDAVNCAIEVQRAMVERNAEVAPDKRIEFRVGIHVGDVVEESDGDLMGDGVNVAARLESIAKPGAICLSEQAYWQVKGRLDVAVTDLGPTELKNIAQPIHVYSLQVGVPAQAKPAPMTTYRDLRPGRFTKPLERLRAGLGRDDFAAAGLKKLAPTPFWRAKLSDEARLLMQFVPYNGETVCLFLEVIPDHAYEKSRFLRGASVDRDKIEAGPPDLAPQPVPSARSGWELRMAAAGSRGIRSPRQANCSRRRAGGGAPPCATARHHRPRGLG